MARYNGKQGSGNGLPEDLLKRINATHSRTKQLGSNGRPMHQKTGKGYSRPGKMTSQRVRKPLDIARERKSKHLAKNLEDSDDEDDAFADDLEEDGRQASRRNKSKTDDVSEDGSSSEHDDVLQEDPYSTTSSAVKSALDGDDAEIAALEKKLGLKGKNKLPQSFEDEGLVELLGDLGHDLDNKRKRDDYAEFLSSKRSKHAGQPKASNKKQGSRVIADPDVSDNDDTNSGSDEENSDDPFGGFSSETSEIVSPVKKRENPYVAPISNDNADKTTKYVPPSLRGPPTSEVQALSQLRRKLQGLLNRLSDANLVSILNDVERMYDSNPRQHVTSSVIDLLMGLFCDKTTLNDTFIQLHAGFVAALYKIIGEQFGAQLLERIVSDFDKFYADRKNRVTIDKETSNLMALIAAMYTFKVVGSAIMFDYIRIFLQELTELNTELLLKLIKACGLQLRKEDPLALKDIATMLQNSVADAGEANLSVRTKFMIELIDNLKNNKTNKNSLFSQITSEHVVKMRKILSSLNQRNLKATEPLGVRLTDIQASEKQGKWWLVGSSWKNDSLNKKNQPAETLRSGSSHESNKKAKSAEQSNSIDAGEDIDLTALAKSLRLNTDIRRAIFVAIMSASDYQDAQIRLSRLQLKNNQTQEISRVVLILVASEEIYNPYYASITRKLCATKKLRMSFQFGLWGLFRRMGERARFADGDDEGADNEGDDAVDLRKVVSYAKFYGELVADNALPITILKVLNIPVLQQHTKVFLEVMLVTLLLRINSRAKEKHIIEQKTAAVFAELKENVVFAMSFRQFIRDTVKHSELASGDKQKKVVRAGCKLADHVLKELQANAIAS